MNKCINLRKKVFLCDGMLGAVWIGLCLVKAFELPGIIEKFVLAFIAAGLCIVIGSLFCKCEKEDEMSKQNMLKAESKTYRVLQVSMIIAMLFALSSKPITLNIDIFILLLGGVVPIIRSLSFIYYEKHGE